MSTEAEINRGIEQLNNRGKAVIFVVTGNNSSGKTMLTLELLKNLHFYQSINLGLASKLIRKFRRELAADSLENFNGGEASQIFKEMVDFIAHSYQETGVNVVIDGVQADTERLSGNPDITGGVILEVNRKLAEKRGIYPRSHFKRNIREKGLKSVKYVPTDRFIAVTNNGSIDEAYQETLGHLGRLLSRETNG